MSDEVLAWLSALHVVQMMPPPPDHLLLHQNPQWLTFLVPAYTGYLGKNAVKWVSIIIC